MASTQYERKALQTHADTCHLHYIQKTPSGHFSTCQWGACLGVSFSV